MRTQSYEVPAIKCTHGGGSGSDWDKLKSQKVLNPGSGALG